jgi:hypothetical protein
MPPARRVTIRVPLAVAGQYRSGRPDRHHRPGLDLAGPRPGAEVRAPWKAAYSVMRGLKAHRRTRTPMSRACLPRTPGLGARRDGPSPPPREVVSPPKTGPIGCGLSTNELWIAVLPDLHRPGRRVSASVGRSRRRPSQVLAANRAQCPGEGLELRRVLPCPRTQKERPTRHRSFPTTWTGMGLVAPLSCPQGTGLHPFFIEFGANRRF